MTKLQDFYESQAVMTEHKDYSKGPVDLSEWTLFSDKGSSKNYFSPDEKWYLKLFHPFNDQQYAQLEQERQRALDVLALGVPTPRVGDIVRTTDGHFGLIFENIVNKKSVSRAISQDPDNYKRYMDHYIDAVSALHATECNTEIFPNVIDTVWENAQTLGIFNDEELQVIRRVLDELPSATTCIHMDAHLANVITAPAGDYFIDLGGFSYGSPLFDECMVYYFLVFLPDDVTETILHFSGELRMRVWEYWLSAYKHIDNQTDREAYEKIMRRMFYLNLIAISSINPYANKYVAMLKEPSGFFQENA